MAVSPADPNTIPNKDARRPDAATGFAASQAANAGPAAEGNVGAGATVGKIYGRPMKGGIGTAAWQISG